MGTPGCDSQNLSLRFVWEMSKPQRLELLLEMQLESTDEGPSDTPVELLKASVGSTAFNAAYPNRLKTRYFLIPL